MREKAVWKMLVHVEVGHGGQFSLPEMALSSAKPNM